MEESWERREFMKLMALGGVTFASALGGCFGASASGPTSVGPTRPAADDEFFFLQLSDTHWGYQGPDNPESGHTLRDTVRIINASPLSPRFVMFTGDLVQTTRDDAERDARMRQFRDIISDLRVPTLHFIPGEHDAAVDQGAAYRRHFGAPSYSFDSGGIHFIALDNASDPVGGLGEAQLAWMRQDLSQVPRTTKVVVFAHRPLFPLFPSWTWNTPDGAQALERLAQHDNVTVFYGHIHQEHHFRTGHIAHHAARSLIFPLPLAGSTPSRSPRPWQAAMKDHGLGYRSVHAARAGYVLQEVTVGSEPDTIAVSQR